MPVLHEVNWQVGLLTWQKGGCQLPSRLEVPHAPYAGPAHSGVRLRPRRGAHQHSAGHVGPAGEGGAGVWKWAEVHTQGLLGLQAGSGRTWATDVCGAEVKCCYRRGTQTYMDCLCSRAPPFRCQHFAGQDRHTHHGTLPAAAGPQLACCATMAADRHQLARHPRDRCVGHAVNRWVSTCSSGALILSKHLIRG